MPDKSFGKKSNDPLTENFAQISEKASLIVGSPPYLSMFSLPIMLIWFPSSFLMMSLHHTVQSEWEKNIGGPEKLQIQHQHENTLLETVIPK